MGRGWPWPLLPQAGGAGRLGWSRPEFQSPEQDGAFPSHLEHRGAGGRVPTVLEGPHTTGAK